MTDDDMPRPAMPRPVKTYLGDGCYADNDGFAIHVTTENGERVTNCIVLEPETYVALVRYAETIGFRRST